MPVNAASLTADHRPYNCETLGFRLDKIDRFVDYAWALMGTLLDSQGRQHLHSDDWHRTVPMNRAPFAR